MLRNYFLIAWRNLGKNKAFSFVNILGLSLGLAACLLIAQYVGFQRSYDSFHERANRLYRVQLNSYHEGKLEYQSAVNYPAVGPAFRAELPEVESFARLNPTGGLLVDREGTQKSLLVEGNRAFYADAALLEIFSFPLLMGTGSALAEPNQLLLSASAARRLFGNGNPLGKTLFFRRKAQQTSYTVGGVFADVPANSHLQFDVLFSYPTLVQEVGEKAENAWWWYDFYTYILLKPGADAGALERKLPGLVRKYKGEELRKSNRHVTFALQPLRDIHLYSRLRRETSVNGNGRLTHFMSVIAFLVLLLAWINYVNLTTAGATQRIKEIGIRKAIGASRRELFGQFLLESMVVNGIALLVSCTVYQFALPLLEHFLAVSIPPLHLARAPTGWLIAALLLANVGVPGAYPALLLSGIRPSAFFLYNSISGH